MGTASASRMSSFLRFLRMEVETSKSHLAYACEPLNRKSYTCLPKLIRSSRAIVAGGRPGIWAQTTGPRGTEKQRRLKRVFLSFSCHNYLKLLKIIQKRTAWIGPHNFRLADFFYLVKEICHERDKQGRCRAGAGRARKREKPPGQKARRFFASVCRVETGVAIFCSGPGFCRRLSAPSNPDRTPERPRRRPGCPP